ncbi:hypothetical protein BD626DRAFT_566706 [Schizophyllum amplum]|uniref:Uncharacterized protein n=1 Tax=Schizophyllum amplum TaxID=97359 RepID=A0A550CMU9_9AGAR|nr:hypothetical protein BD626DRAFT_566706 [Auriculariopsis ampla]
MSTTENKSGTAAAEGLKAILRNKYIADETKQDAERRLKEGNFGDEKLSRSDQDAEDAAHREDLKARDFAFESDERPVSC